MKERAQSGEQIFYDIYSDAEKKADPEKKDTGLFFFRGDAGAKTAIVNAGGGFVYVAGIHDSFPQALELSKKGYNAFTLIEVFKGLSHGFGLGEGTVAEGWIDHALTFWE